MTNVFNASFDDLLAQAGIAEGQMSQTVETAPTQTVDTTNSNIVVTPHVPDLTAPTQTVDRTSPSTTVTPHVPDLTATIPSFDDLLAQTGIEDVTPQPENANITEEYRVSTDIFGENDKPSTPAPEPTPVAPNAAISFDELMAQAGGITTEEQTPAISGQASIEQTDVEPAKVIEESTEAVEEPTVEPSKAIEEPKVAEATEPKPKQTKPRTKRTKTKQESVEDRILSDADIEEIKQSIQSKPVSDELLDDATIDEIKQTIRNIVRDAVRASFKEAMQDLAKSFE